MKDKIKQVLEDSISINKTILDSQIDTIMAISDVIIDSLQKGGKLIIFGNGGSAADSQHIAAEFVGRFKKNRQALPAIALTVNTSIITAIANDFGYNQVFSKQIEALANPKDIVIGISTSGNAESVIEGIKKAKDIGIKTIGFVGAEGGSLSKQADISLNIPSEITARIQEGHIIIGHIICELAEEKLTEK